MGDAERSRGGVGVGVSAEAILLESEQAPRGRRRSVVSRSEGDRARMIRFVLAPDGGVVPDLAERLGGRGLWVEAERSRLIEAIRKNAFAKAVRAPVRTDPQLLEHIESGLRQRCLELLGLARRAGFAVAGHDQVEAALRKGIAAVLLIARDAGSEAKRLERLAKGVPVFRLLSREGLGRALGRDELTYVAVTRSGLAERLIRELLRLAGVLGEERGDGNGTQVGGDDR